VREHNEAVNRLDVILAREAIKIEQEAGGTLDVVQHDGSVLRLRRLDGGYPPDRIAAMNLQQRQARGEVVTGLLHVDPEAGDLHGYLGTVEAPLNSLDAPALCPGSKALADINAALR